MIIELTTGSIKHTLKIGDKILEVGHNENIIEDVTIGNVTNKLKIETFNNSGICIYLRDRMVLATDKVSFIKGYKIPIYNFNNITLEIDSDKIVTVR